MRYVVTSCVICGSHEIEAREPRRRRIVQIAFDPSGSTRHPPTIDGPFDTAVTLTTIRPRPSLKRRY